MTVTIDIIEKALSSVTDTLCAFIVSIEKGWLPAGTSQDDLDDSDFLWLSNKYKADKTSSKSAGRKLPIAIHGKVSVRGWMAAWAALHGSRGGVNFGGGPSREQMIAKLKSRKPSGVTIEGDHASASSSANKAEEVITFPTFAEINKSEVDIKLGIIFGKASVAGIVDRQGDVISRDELEKAAYAFMENANRRITNTHKETIPGKFVASYIDGDTWIIGVKPDDINVAKAAAKGEFVGFSIGGSAVRIPIVQ